MKIYVKSASTQTRVCPQQLYFFLTLILSVSLAFGQKTSLPKFTTIESKRNDPVKIPTVDISKDVHRQTVVAAGTKDIYQGHCDTLLLPDGKTMFTAWCTGHAKFLGPLAKSHDARLTWSKSFQYPTFRKHKGKVYLCVTQGDHSKSRKERIMFGELE